MIGKIFLALILILGVIQVGSAIDQSCFSDSSSQILHCPDGSDRISSLESLLRDQSRILSSFDNLQNTTITNDDQKSAFLASLEDLIRRQAILISGFEDILRRKWCGMTKDERYKFLASFKDLIDREVLLIANFNLSLDINWHRFSDGNKTKFIASLEDLLKRKAALFRSYQELYDKTYGGLSVNKSVDKTHIKREDAVIYTYVVKNWYNNSTIGFTLTDDQLGVIASNVSLGPGKDIIFHKKAILEKSTCNMVTIYWKDVCGIPQETSSLRVCVFVEPGGIKEPIQYEQFCSSGTITGTGLMDVQTHILDKKIALGYDNSMSGDGDVNLKTSQVYSQVADKLRRIVPLMDSYNNSSLNFFDDTQMTYNGSTPLIGKRSLISKEREGGMGTELHEDLNVNSIEKDQTTFYGSTTNATNSQVMGSDIKSSFNGTFGTEELWHEMFNKDINARQRLTGTFEVRKAAKLHRRPVTPKAQFGCDGIDC